MAQVTITTVEYKNFGKCIQLSNGSVKLLATIDLGPRIINYSFVDGENIMFEDVNRDFTASGPEFDKFGGGTWYIYGGHRLWTSPEGMPKSYYPDNTPVPYEIIENGVRLMPEPQKWNQYAFEIEVTMEPDTGAVNLVHKVTNTAAWPVELAPWTMSVLSPGGKEFVPQPTKETGLLGNRLLALWPYTKLTDARVHWGDKFISLTQNPENQDKFKFGINSEHGYAMYFNHGDLFVKQFTPIEGGNYPDGGMSFETFTNNYFLEMESLGELAKIEPEQTVTHAERWCIYKEECPKTEDEDVLEALAAKYVR